MNWPFLQNLEKTEVLNQTFIISNEKICRYLLRYTYLLKSTLKEETSFIGI